jgi:CRISPR-associated protein Cmr1
MVRTTVVRSPMPSNLVSRRDVLVDIQLAVVTPLFGGGAAPRVSDGLLPIRGAAVRGHLRFWWRACHAHLFADAADLFARESAVWGETAGGAGGGGPSAIDVEVRIVDPGTCESYFPWRDELNQEAQPRWRFQGSPSFPDYALFPFQGVPKHGFPPEQWQPPPSDPLIGVKFRLQLTVSPSRSSPLPRDELATAAERAVAAWVLFGGIGARTRRGCGSLWCMTEDERFLPRTRPQAAESRERWSRAKDGVWIPRVVDARPSVTKLGVPRLQGATLIVHPADFPDPIAA